jgi:hypothetical protein
MVASRSKIAIATLFVAFVLSAVAASSASAQGWFINGTKLTGSAAIATTAKVKKPWLLEIIEGVPSIVVKCAQVIAVVANAKGLSRKGYVGQC